MVTRTWGYRSINRLPWCAMKLSCFIGEWVGVKVNCNLSAAHLMMIMFPVQSLEISIFSLLAGIQLTIHLQATGHLKNLEFCLFVFFDTLLWCESGFVIPQEEHMGENCSGGGGMTRAWNACVRMWLAKISFNYLITNERETSVMIRSYLE